MTILSSMLMLCFCVTSAKAVGIVRVEKEQETKIVSVDADGALLKTGGGECPLPDNAKWCTVTLGEPFQMAVYAKDDIVSDSICKTGTWELLEKDMAAFGPVGHALDIGANVGFYSLALANRGWNVIAFEPMAANNALMEATMCRNPALNAKITLNKFGLGAKSDHCVIVSGDTNLGDGVSKCGEDASKFEKNGQLGYHVRAAFDVHRLDDVLVEQAVKQIDFVKMDVEGFEGQVMKGGQSLLTKFRPRLIQSEVWHNMNGVTPTDYLGSFAKASYTVASDRACTVPDASRPVAIDNRYMCTKTAASLLENVVTRSHAVRSTVFLRRD